MSDNEKQVMNEINSSIRNQAIADLYQKNKKIINITLVLLALFALVFLTISLYQNKQKEKYSNILHQSMTDYQMQKFSDAKEKLLEVYSSKSSPSGLKTIAGLRLSAIYLNENSKKGIENATKIYEEISNCKNCPKYASNLTGLLLVKFWLINEDFYNDEKILEKINKIADKSQFFKYEIFYEQAFFELRQNNLEKSYNKFELIAKSPEASKEIQEDAKKGMNIVLSKGYKLQKNSDVKK